MSEDYEFEDDDAPKAAPKKSKSSGGADFDPFADEDTGTASPVAAPPPAAPAQAPASSGGGFNAFDDADDGASDSDDGDADIKPGQGKDLWICPHCGAKNKPKRETCRACGKHPDDEVIIPLFSRPEVKIGLLAVIAIVLAVLFFTITAKDFSLKNASAATVTADYVHDDTSMMAGVGRILRVKPIGEKLDLVIVFGEEVNTDDFDDLKGPNKFFEVKRGNFGVQPHVRFVLEGAAPEMKHGDYIAFSGTTDAEKFKEARVQRHFTVNTSDMQFNVSGAE